MRKHCKQALSLFLALVMVLGLMPGVSLAADEGGGAYVLAETIEVGKAYVIVADGQFALNNQTVDWGGPYTNQNTTATLGSTPVTVEDGVITSSVTEDMLWTFEPADDAFDGKLYDLPMYHLYDQAGQMLSRLSGSTATAPLVVGGSPSKVPYTTISFYPRPDGSYTTFFNTNQSNDYPFSFHGTENGFNAPGVAQSSWTPETYQSSIQLFELSGGNVTIDFTNPADAEKFTVDNPTDSSIIEGEGFYMISTNEAIEDCKGQLSGDAANTPRDLVQVPISGDWTATLYLKVDTSGSNGQYEFLCLFGMADYDNGGGIRAGNGSTVNFKEVDGVNESSTDGMKISTGLTSGEYHWYRLEKAGTTYTGYLSEDGEAFQKVFTYEDTGIEASMIVIDAYSGRSVGYQYWLQSLTIEKASNICSHEYADEVIAPTCTEQGYTLHTCGKCGRTYKSDFVDALGHDFGEYVKTKDFTETERGELTSTCSRCDATKTRPIAAGNEKPHQNEILFISDVHSARKAEEGFHNLRALFPLLKSVDNFIPEVVCGGGDYIESSTNDTVDWPHCYEVLHDVIYNGAPDTYQALTSGNHEWEWSQQSDEMIEKLLGQPRVCNSYNSEDFTVFQIGAHMNGTGQENLLDADVAKLAAFLEEEAASGKNRVVFIQTHWPLHYAYNHAWRTTQNAGKVIDLLNSYSDSMDIVWVWGHNHRHDANRHMFRTRNFIMPVSSTEKKMIRFTYLNAGCLNENGAEQDTGPSGSNYGPGYCLEARLTGDKLILDYAHITGAYPDPTAAKLDHNADLLYVQTIQEARESHKEIQLVHHGECEHDYVLTHTEPTCLDWGTNSYKCSKCGLEYYDDVDEPLGHAWDEGVITTEPTENRQGVKTFTCSRCGETKTKPVPRKGVTLPETIDFTTADSADLYEIVNPTAAQQTDNGLVTTTTRPAMEDCNGQNSGDQAINPEDLIKVPVSGDWSATLTFDFDTNSASNGYYQFFGFYAAEGEDYQNLAGIRGGDKAFQDFLRLDGAITADTDEVVSAPGLDTVKTYWLRIEKYGDTYYCYRSDDGDEFTEMFRYEDTGIEAEHIIIDAYTGMTTGYKFTLQSLEFDESAHLIADLPPEKAPLEAAVEAAEKLDPADYTEETAKALLDAIEAAKKALAEAKTQGEIDAAQKALDEAVAALVEKSEPTPTPTPGHDCPGKIFTDMPAEGNWAHDPIDWAIVHNITAGATKTTFAPGSGCTRAQVVTFLWRAAGQPEPTSTATAFTDLKADGYYIKAVAWAVENGVTAGISKDKFAPNNTCTRAQVVTFLYRVAK